MSQQRVRCDLDDRVKVTAVTGWASDECPRHDKPPDAPAHCAGWLSRLLRSGNLATGCCQIARYAVGWISPPLETRSPGSLSLICATACCTIRHDQ